MDLNWILNILTSSWLSLLFLPLIGYYCWHNVYDYNDLADALTVLDTNEATIFIPNPQDINEDLTIPSNIALEVIQGGTLNIGKFSIRNATYQWTVSPADADEYFLELAGGGDPGLSDPLKVYENDVLMDIGVLGVLAVGEWNYGDNDGHGWDTIYVRIIGSGDPDAQAIDYVEAGYVVTINGYVDAGLYQIFEGDGSVTGDIKVDKIPVAWFGPPGDNAADDLTAFRNTLSLAQVAQTPMWIHSAPTGWLLSSYLDITVDGTRIICDWNNSPIRQSTWGAPIFYVRADNVSIDDPYMVSTEARDAIPDDMATAWAGDGAENEGTLAAFNFSAGIFISAARDDKGSNFNCNRWHAEGFTVGIFARGSAGQVLLDCNLGDGDCKTVDWGVVAALFTNLNIPSLKGVDIIQGGAAPSAEHVLYITGGGAGDCSRGLIIGELSARNVGNDNHAFQIKYTEDVVIGGAVAVDCEAMFSFVGEVTGVIGQSAISLPAVVSGVNPVIYVATDCILQIESPRIIGAFASQGIAVNDSKVIVHDPHIINTKGSALANNVFYVTGGGRLEVYNPKVEYSFTPTDYCFEAANIADTIIIVHNPTIIGIGATCLFFEVNVLADADNCYLSFDPKLLSNQPAETSIQINGDTGKYNVVFLGQTDPAIALATANATPVINRATYYSITNAGATNITDFDRSPVGHRFTIEASGDGNTTFVHAANQLETFDGNNYALPDGKAIEFVERGGVFYETWRSV